MWGISASTEHPKEAMILLNEMYTNPELSNVPYTAQSWIWPGAFSTPVWEPYPEDYWKQIEDFNNTALRSKALGFVPDTSAITNEITACYMSVGRIFYSDFGLFFQVPMNSGPLFDVTNTIDTYVYRGLLQLNDIGRASAAGFYQSLIGFVIVLSANAIVRKVEKENALF